MYKDYLKTRWWKETKGYLRFIKKKRCYVCRSKKFLDVHHLHYRTLGYEDGSELVYLCRKHHKKLHFYTGEKRTPDTLKDEMEMREILKVMREESYNQDEFIKTLLGDVDKRVDK